MSGSYENVAYKCFQCDGTGIVLVTDDSCETCHGRRTVTQGYFLDCSKCNGRGKSNSYECRDCGGKGKINSYKCGQCRGEGKIKSYKCDQCGGNGKGDYKTREIECESCKRTGKSGLRVGIDKKPCAICAGRGFIVKNECYSHCYNDAPNWGGFWND